MGVKGLLKKAQQDASTSFIDLKENIPKHSTLLIDGNGFLFHLLEIQMDLLYPDLTFKRELGGDYGRLNRLIIKEVTRLKHLGFSLLFYFDGSKSYFKGDTTSKRKKTLEEHWHNLFYLSRGEKVEQYKLPLPPLAFHELHRILEQSKCHIIHCEFEADPVIARDCNKLNHHPNLKGKAYCYSKDR